MTHQLVLIGLDGSNPLAFLAALGTFRTLDFGWRGEAAKVRMSWRAAGAWRPVLHADMQLNATQVVDTLDRQLRDAAGQRAFAMADSLKLTGEAFRGHATEAAQNASLSDRRVADFIGAFGCDCVCTEDGLIEDTALRTMSGAGHQHFLKFMRELAADTTAEHLHQALFQRWEYADPGPSMRWDPADDRRYALRWDEPSGDPVRTVRGANRLAVEGLAMFPVVPVGTGLLTTGFSGRGSRGTFWKWPIWESPVSLDVARSLLALPDLQEAVIPRERLRRMGVVEVFRSQRLTIGKYRNYAPAEPA